MRLRPKRLALHSAAVALLAAGAVLWGGAPGSADAATRPDSYGGTSTATGMHFQADRNPQPTPVVDPFHAELPYATSYMDSSGAATAQAASLYPGGGFLGLVPLLCQFDKHFCSLPLPRYPLMASADYPTTPDDTADAPPKDATVEQGPLSVDPNVTTAHADANRVEAREASGSTGVADVVTAGSAAIHSKQFFEGSALVSSAESVLKDVDIGGGKLHIDEIRSLATSRVEQGARSKTSAVTTVTGATAGGQSVEIDSSGVHVGGSGDKGVLTGTANTALAALDAQGIKVRLVAPTKKSQTGVGSATAGGLLITFTHSVDVPAIPVPNAPSPNGVYTGSMTIAGAGVSAFATAGDGFGLPTIGVPPIAAPAQPAAGPAVPAAPGVAAATQPLSPNGAAPTLAGPAGKATPTAVLGVDLTGKRLKSLCLVLLGYPLLVLLTAPLRAPARLPRA